MTRGGRGTAVNVDGGNAPTRPAQTGALRPLWRVTWIAIIGLVALFLLWGTRRGADLERERGTTSSVEQEAPRRSSQPE
jgi:hypothetical protein